MYSHCLSCNAALGTNEVIEEFPIGRRLAFDPERGRLWAICRSCDRWNLVPIEERWEAVEACERLFRATRLRYSTTNIGLAEVPPAFGLIRIGSPLKPEMAAWRYGRYLQEWLPGAAHLGSRVGHLADRTVGFVAARLGVRRDYDLTMWLRFRHRPDRVVARAESGVGTVAIRIRDLEQSELKRPDPGEGWRLVVPHDGGILTLSGDRGLSVAGKLLARLNGRGASEQAVQYAVAKLSDAANPDGYFARVAAIALRSWWGRHPDGLLLPAAAPVEATDSERLALHLTKRSFWGRGGFGSEPTTRLPRLPLVDRLALEMAANDDTERRALDGELALLEWAYREAEALAAISDSLLMTSGYTVITRSKSPLAGRGLSRGRRLCVKRSTLRGPSRPRPSEVPL